jgi:hypothetical protein
MLVRVAAAVVLVAAASAIGGYAYAVSSAPATTLGACAKSDGGQLRLDTGDGCRPSEQAVQLGTAAASRADMHYYAAPRLFGGTTAFPIPVGRFPDVLANATPVLTIHVPAGSYTSSTEITAVNFSGNGNLVCLNKDSNNVTHGYMGTSLGNTQGAAAQQTITMHGAYIATEDTDLRVFCFLQNFGGPVGNPEIWAAAITTQSVDAATITQETH